MVDLAVVVHVDVSWVLILGHYAQVMVDDQVKEPSLPDVVL